MTDWKPIGDILKMPMEAVMGRSAWINHYRRDRYDVDGFRDCIGVSLAKERRGVVSCGKPKQVVSNRQFPAATLVACAGKPILEVIDHPVTRKRYGPGDVIERAFWDDEAQVSVFEVRRAA